MMEFMLKNNKIMSVFFSILIPLGIFIALMGDRLGISEYKNLGYVLMIFGGIAMMFIISYMLKLIADPKNHYGDNDDLK